MTTTDLLKRAGIDPILADKRPLSEIMDDYVPYDRWAEEAAARAAAAKRLRRK